VPGTCEESTIVMVFHPTSSASHGRVDSHPRKTVVRGALMTRASPLSLPTRIRSALARRFLVKLRRATHRMPVQLVQPHADRVLVVAPHMDDEAIACGGSLILHRKAGSEVRVVFVSDSCSGVPDPALAQRLIAQRRAEMAQAQAVLGYQSIAAWDFPDGQLVRHEHAIATRLAQELRDFRPGLLMCPFPLDGHADHQACALAVAQAVAGWEGRIFAYEVWSPLWPNAAIDISAVVGEKEVAIRRYASQIADRDYAAGILALNRYRGLQHRIPYAEAFHVCEAAQFARLAAGLNDLL